MHVEALCVGTVVSGSSFSLLSEARSGCGSAEFLTLVLHTTQPGELEGQDDGVGRSNLINSTTGEALTEGQGRLLRGDRDSFAERVCRGEDNRWRRGGTRRGRRGNFEDLLLQ